MYILLHGLYAALCHCINLVNRINMTANDIDLWKKKVQNRCLYIMDLEE